MSKGVIQAEHTSQGTEAGEIAVSCKWKTVVRGCCLGYVVVVSAGAAEQPRPKGGRGPRFWVGQVWPAFHSVHWGSQRFLGREVRRAVIGEYHTGGKGAAVMNSTWKTPWQI